MSEQLAGFLFCGRRCDCTRFIVSEAKVGDRGAAVAAAEAAAPIEAPLAPSPFGDLT